MRKNKLLNSEQVPLTWNKTQNIKKEEIPNRTETQNTKNWNVTEHSNTKQT